MKMIRMIQNVMIVAGIFTAVSLVDGIEVSASNMWAAFVIACFSVLVIVEREVNGGKDNA
ncbi:hypothetical protein [Bacteroides finegoldii]|jgi:hypothetical protein|uniref:hypothetical protein n=1 Tax=Bacteroides finegoldii TaxID=338188 RepID=UPI00189F66E6|nr:hypothetical protein [Bacteroides finegoldii]